MKKLIIVMVVVCLLCSVAVAENLSSLSYEDLLVLRDELNAEIMSRPEWKQALVPVGTWYTGTDIPIGYYSITSTNDLSIVRLVDKNDHFIFYKTMEKDEVAGKVYFEEGSVLTVYDPIYLSPPLSLGF